MLLSDKAVSLLPVGITSVEGEWEEGDIVNILAPDGSAIGWRRITLIVRHSRCDGSPWSSAGDTL